MLIKVFKCPEINLILKLRSENFENTEQAKVIWLFLNMKNNK